METSLKTWTSNQRLIEWIDEVKTLCQPDRIHLCDGSEKEYDAMMESLIASGCCQKLNETLRPNSYLCRSSPDDVARVEKQTFICSLKKEDAGPTNNWCDPIEMKDRLNQLFKGCMKGRTLYVIPFCMGPLNSPISLLGVQITDSPYVVASMKLMTRMGKKVLPLLENRPFIPCLHSVGKPLAPGEKDDPWPCNNDNKYIVHFPEERSIVSFGSGYGGNALLGKKCLSLRIASVMARDEGWFAEHMLILGVTNPEGIKKYIAAAFPSACGKTNLAMMRPMLPGWKIETVGDDIAWMKFDSEGRLFAINPESGFFGVAPGTSEESNPNAMATVKKNAIFTNVALTDEGDVWWEGMTKKAPNHLINWLGRDWTPDSKDHAAHPNSRFTVAASQCPSIDPAWEDPQGVQISAILFGGRRSSVVPLVYEAFDWRHGIFLGASTSSQTTAAAAGEIGKLRHDPFAMLPFCGYNMGDYFRHWIEMEKDMNPKHLPKMFYVNWFRKDENGKFLWPGYGENIRVLKWIFERVTGFDHAEKTPIGRIPTLNALDLSGLSISQEKLKSLFHIDREEWKKEIESLQVYFKQFGDKLPEGIIEQLDALAVRIHAKHPNFV